MERDGDPRPIEVELTPSAATTARRRRFGRRSDVDQSPERPSAAATSIVVDGSEESSERVVAVTSEPNADSAWPRRTTAVGAAAALVGLAAGWLIASGNSASDGVATPTESSVSTSVSPEATDTADDSALTPIDTIRPTTTERTRRTTTTTTFPEPVVETLTLHPALAGGEFEIIGLVDNDKTATIDATTSVMSTQKWTDGFIDPFVFEIGDDWVIAGDQSSGAVRVMTSDGVSRTSRLGEVWNLLRVPDSDLFWRGSVRDTQTGAFTRFEQVDLDGAPTGPEIEAQGNWAFGVDPAGGLLTIVQGKTYSLRVDGVEYVGAGELIAVSETTAILRSCDEELDCGVLVVDRASGEERLVRVDDDRFLGAGLLWGRPSRHQISPDGAHVATVLEGRLGRELVLIDLESGEASMVSETSTSWGMTWWPGGRFGLFVESGPFVERGVPMLYDAETGAVEPLAEGLDGWSTIDVRPRTSG